MATDRSQPDPTHSAAPDPATRSRAEPANTHSLADPAATTGGPNDGTVATTPPVPATRYELGAEIARGGMGAVYRATDTAFAREVAVKVLQEKYAPTSGTARRFADEARISGQLQHPNIPAVHDLGTLPDGRPFLAMKLIKGETLDDLLKARTGPAEDRGRFIAVFEQVCQALAYAHAHDVIHRDLKPGNVMVGAFGEVQVMDWGLAKVLGTRDAEFTDPEATAAPTAVESLRQTDSAFTQAGSVLGTPAYMPPEQAIGAIHKVDARSDVFGLGAILAVILTGQPPFVGKSAETTRLQAAQGNVEECFARLDASGAEPELVALCKRCLSKKAEDRPADAGEVARAVAALRAAADERARQAELEWARAETQTVEQRKRRRVQLALAGVVLLVAIGGGIAAVQVQRQREIDRFAAEKRRQDDLRAAEDEALSKQRAAKAADLVRALAVAQPGAVPVLLDELAEYRDGARPHLLRLAKDPVNRPSGLRGRLALLAQPAGLSRQDADQFGRDILIRSLNCPIEDYLLILDYYATQGREKFVAEAWEALLEQTVQPNSPGLPPLRLAVGLARFAPTDHRWMRCGDLIAGELGRLNPLEAEPYVVSLAAVRGHLIHPLLKRYPESRTKIESGTLAVTDLAAEATAFDLTANLLARYTIDRPVELAELAMIVDGRHLPLFFDSIQANHETVAPLLTGEIDKTLPADLPSSDDQREALAKRQASAAVALLRLNRPENVWPLLKHSPDPRVRSYLIHRLFPLGADPTAIVKRLDAEPDLSARRALLLALGEFDEATLPAASRTALLPKVQGLYRDDPDPGLHAAAEWLLRQWQQEGWLKQVNDEWAKDEEGRDKRLAGIKKQLASRVASAPGVPPSPPQWFVNTQGQTFTVIPGPVEFRMGSPLTEKERSDDELPQRRRIGRSFAMASKSVTLAQYRSLTKDKYEVGEKYTYDPNLPVVGINWYMAATYCNLLSKAEEISEDQWCYEITGPQAIKLKANYLSLTGYRLPTEAELEYATRAGAATSRYYGETDELLGRYAWYTKSSNEVLKPVGLKKPNDLGLFDAQGNCFTWCQEEFSEYLTTNGDEAVEDKEVGIVVNSTRSRVLRGGAFVNQPSSVRSAFRANDGPTIRRSDNGFRPVRTLVSETSK